MSDQPPVARLGADAPDADDERHVVLRTLVRARVMIVLVPLVVGLLVAASIGADKLFADVPERAVTAPDVTCWNGSQSPAAQCPEPSGKVGLRWVFPSFRPDDSPCEAVNRRKRAAARPVEFACSLSYDQRPITITYSARTELKQGLSFLQRTYHMEPQPEADGDHLAFRSDRPEEGVYRVTIAYAAYPFSVTVEAPEPDLRDTALDELVRFRPADEVLVRG